MMTSMLLIFIAVLLVLRLTIVADWENQNDRDGD